MRFKVEQTMIFRPHSLFTIAATLFAGFNGASHAEQVSAPTSLIQNGGFEAGGTGWYFAPNGAQSTGSVVTNEAHSGTHSYKLTNASGQAPHVFGRIIQTIGGLQPFTTYQISCWAKGQDSGVVWLGGGPGWYLRAPFPHGTFGWTNIVIDYKTDDTPADFDLMILSESETAAVWVDDVKMEAVSADVAARDQALVSWQKRLDDARTLLAELRVRASTNKVAVNDARVQLGFNVAERFIRRIATGGPNGKQSAAWSRLQASEIADVLKETEKQITRASASKAAKQQPWPRNEDVRVRDGLIYARLAGKGWQPFWYYGYGHFSQPITDLPNFRGLGASLVQDGRIGPSSLNVDGTPGPGVHTVLSGLAEAKRFGMREDWLLSPHYFPEWAFAEAPGVRGGGPGFIQYNIDHPVARRVVSDFATKVSKAMQNEDALLTVCLSNEPTYDQSGRNPESRPDWIAWLKKSHGRIERLNELYGTSYTNFDAVPVPGIGLKTTPLENRAYYDWVTFNNQHFADWHAWMRALVKTNLPATPTHAKIMVFYTLDRDKLHFGVDPELFCNATDLAGCDAYAFPQSGTTYDWPGQEFFYDLLHSFRGQPVFNSENHIIPDGNPPNHVPMAMTRAQFWQGGLHHQALTTTWVWEEASDASLAGSIYFRPGNVYGAGRAMLDLNRFGKEVAALNQATPQIALLYSPASVFWESNYKATLMSLYTQLNFLGQPVTFVSERQLAEGKAPKVKWIVVPQSTHTTQQTANALQKFARSGGHLLLAGDHNLEWDEYHRPRVLSPEITHAAKLNLEKDDLQLATQLHDLLAGGGVKMLDLDDAVNGERVRGVEFRVTRADGKTLVSLINLTPKTCSVRAPGLRDKQAMDLLNDEVIRTDKVSLEPMVPRLLTGR